MNTKLISTDNIQKFKLELDNIKINFKPTLALLLSSVPFDIKEIATHLQDNDIDVFGSSTCGLFNYNLDDSKNLHDKRIMVLLLDIKREDYYLGFEKITDEERIIGRKAGEKIKNKFENPYVLTFISGTDKNYQALIESMGDTIDRKSRIFGGIASDDYEFEHQYVVCNTTILNEGITYLAIDGDKYNMEGMVTSGWEPIGTSKIITKSDNYIIYEIDDKPALDYYTESLGIDENELPLKGAEYPLMIEINGGNAIRAVLGVDKVNRSLICGGYVPNGAKVQFSASPGFEVIDNTLNEINRYFENIDRPDVIFVFSCLGRFRAFGPLITHELEGIANLWDKVPMIGFFTYGEFGNEKFQICEFHNESLAITTLNEL